METQALVDDFRVNAERRLTFKGSALVRFEYLRWDEYKRLNEEKRIPDPKHVERIVRIFQGAGCHRLESRNHIPATIDQHQLDAALEDAQRNKRLAGLNTPLEDTEQNERLNAGISSTNNAKPDHYPELSIPGGVQCLRGLHRIEAGKVYLRTTDKWWVIDLYLSGITDELKITLSEEYDDAERPSQGKIYRKIREYQSLPRQANNRVPPITCVRLETRWWTLFSASEERKLRSLFRSRTRNRMLAAGFDALSGIPGLFDAGMRVTTLNKEIQHYCSHIKSVWVGFLNNVDDGLQRVDTATVKEVELRAPGVSSVDADYLHPLMIRGKIFNAFSPSERDIIWGSITRFKGIIPSLSKFFQDIYFLQACVDCIRWLITIPEDKTVFTALEKAYQPLEDTQLVETAETTCWPIGGNRTYRIRVGYLRMIIFAMVYYKDMPKAPAGKNLKEMPRARADAEVIQKYASFARQEGFSSPEIERLTENFQPLQAVDDKAPAPITITTGPGVSLKRRCGLPHMDTFKSDKEHLSLRNLYEENNATGEGITSFFALKSWFIAFFGPLTGPVTDIESRDRLPSPHNQNAIKDLTGIEQHQSKSKDTNADGDVDMTGSGGVVQAKASPTTSETREETLFVPMNSTGSVRASEIGRNVCIKFVDLERNVGSMMEQPLDNKQEHAKCLVVKHDDPESLVAQEVANYLKMGKRVCDIKAKYIPAEECYRVATKEGNKNTLFLTDDVGEDKVMEEVNPFHFQYSLNSQARNVLPKQRSHHPPPKHKFPSPPREFSNAFFAPLTEAADPEIKLELGDKVDFSEIRPHVPTNESNMLHQEPMVNTPPGEQQDGEESDSVLKEEEGNAANAHIYNPMTVICLKKVVASSYDAGKRREEMEWKDFPPIHVPTKDPEGNVMAQMSHLSSAANLTPHNKDLRRLAYQDCYRVAKADNDHTLYLMPGDQGLPKNQTLVEGDPENHRDKIGAASGKSGRKVGLSFYSDETHRIRKAPEDMRKGDDSIHSRATIKKRPKKEARSRRVEQK